MKVLTNPEFNSSIKLLKKCQLPYSDIKHENLSNLLHLGTKTQPIALIGLELFNQVALLRSLAVDPEKRNLSLVKILVLAIEKYAKIHDIEKLFLLTETSEVFFQRLGYKTISKESAPSSIKNTAEFAYMCPKIAVLMFKQLNYC